MSFLLDDCTSVKILPLPRSIQTHRLGTQLSVTILNSSFGRMELTNGSRLTVQQKNNKIWVSTLPNIAPVVIWAHTEIAKITLLCDIKLSPISKYSGDTPSVLSEFSKVC